MRPFAKNFALFALKLFLLATVTVGKTINAKDAKFFAKGREEELGSQADLFGLTRFALRS